jgi:hypothetical protein
MKNVKNRISYETWSQSRRQVYTQVHTQVCLRIDEQIYRQLWLRIHFQTCVRIRDQVKEIK